MWSLSPLTPARKRAAFRAPAASLRPQLAGFVEFADHAGIGQVVALEHHPSIAALQSFLDFAVDHLTEPPPRAVRRHNQMAVDAALVVVLKELEQPLHLRSDPAVRRQAARGR